MKQPLIECVPNFSEGNDLSVIQQITSEIEGVDGVKLLDVDPGKADEQNRRHLHGGARGGDRSSGPRGKKRPLSSST